MGRSVYHIALYSDTIDLLTFLNFMACIDTSVDFQQEKKQLSRIYDEVKLLFDDNNFDKISSIKSLLQQNTNQYIKRYPLKKPIKVIAKEYNDFFKEGLTILERGLQIGWLQSVVDIKNIRMPHDVPYHFKIGIGVHKGFGGIEEDNLLKDAFNALNKVHYSIELLNNYGKIKAKEERANNKFTQDTYINITDLKFEVCAYSRLCIIAFYSFVECFVNSVGFNWLYRNMSTLSENEKEILRGYKKGRYCSLDFKIEKFQAIINPSKVVQFNLSDPNQIATPFKEFFDYYESIRNSSVHFSPEKERIWLKPHDWAKIVDDFSKISMSVALKFWQACHPNSDGPVYLGKLDFDLHKKLAKKRFRNIKSIEREIS